MAESDWETVEGSAVPVTAGDDDWETVEGSAVPAKPSTGHKKAEPKKWEKPAGDDIKLMSAHGEGARRAELINKLNREVSLGKQLARKIARLGGAGLGGAVGAIVTGAPTLGGLATMGGILGAGMGYGVGDVAGNVLFGADPSKELDQMGPLNPEGLKQSNVLSGFVREGLKPQVAGKSIENLVGMPYEMTKGVAEGYQKEGLKGAGKAGFEVVKGLVELPATATGLKDLYQKVTGEQPLDWQMREMQWMAENDPTGLLLGFKMAPHMPKATWAGIKAVATKGTDLALRPFVREGDTSAMSPERWAQSALKMRITDTANNARARAAAIKTWLSDPNASLSMNTFVDRNISEMSDIVGKQNLLIDELSKEKGGVDVRVDVTAFENGVNKLLQDTPTSLMHGGELASAVESVVRNIKTDKTYDPATNTISARAANDIKKQVWEDLRGKGQFAKDYHPAMVEAAWKGATVLNELVNSIIPEMKGLNTRYGELAHLNKQMMRALQRGANNNIVPLRALLHFAAGDVRGVVSGAALWVLDEPWFKAAIARKLAHARSAYPDIKLPSVKEVINTMRGKMDSAIAGDISGEGMFTKGPERVPSEPGAATVAAPYEPRAVSEAPVRGGAIERGATPDTGTNAFEPREFDPSVVSGEAPPVAPVTADSRFNQVAGGTRFPTATLEPNVVPEQQVPPRVLRNNVERGATPDTGTNVYEPNEFDPSRVSKSKPPIEPPLAASTPEGQSQYVTERGFVMRPYEGEVVPTEPAPRPAQPAPVTVDGEIVRNEPQQIPHITDPRESVDYTWQKWQEAEAAGDKGVAQWWMTKYEQAVRYQDAIKKGVAGVAVGAALADEDTRNKLTGMGGLAIGMITPKAMKSLKGGWSKASAEMAAGKAWDQVKGDFNASLVRMFNHGEMDTAGKALKAPKKYVEVEGPPRVSADGKRTYPQKFTGKYERTGEYTPTDYMDSLVEDQFFMKLSPFERVKIFSEVERAYGTSRTKAYKATQSLAQNTKLAGSNIVAVDTIRGCTNNCPSCFANAGGGQGNITHTALVPQTWTGTLNPKNVLRVGEVGDPAMDWSYSNGLVSDAINRSKGASFDKNLFAITKLQSIEGFDPKIWRNLEVSLDPLMPDHMATTMRNIQAIKQMDPSVNIVVRIRSFKSRNPELMAEQQKAVDFANKQGLEILETKLRFKNRRYLAAIDLDPTAYKAGGAQLVYNGESVLRDVGNRSADITICGEGEIKGRCLSCRGCEKLATRSVPKDYKATVEYYREQFKNGAITSSELSEALAKLSGGANATR